MKNLSVIGFFILLALLTACSESHVAKFPETVAVTTSQLNFDSVYMKYPYRVKLFNSTLYVMNLHPIEFYCQEFEYPSMKFIRSFARKGKAPDELIGIGNVAVGESGLIYVLDDYGRKMYTYDSENGQFDLLIKFPDDAPYYTDFALYNDSVFVFPDPYGQSRLHLVDHHGKIIREIGKIPATEKTTDISDIALWSAWRAFIGCNPHNEIVVLTTQFGEVLEIYNLRTGSTKVIIGAGGEPICTFKENWAYPNGILGYSDVFVGEKHIYALFWGHEYKKVLSREITFQGGNYIHVFDLEGNPVRRYELDRYITGLYVDEARGEVIGTDVNEEQLVTFNL